MAAKSQAGSNEREGKSSSVLARSALGPDDEECSVEVHHGGFFYGSGVDQVYLDGKVDWFDHITVEYWSFYAVDEILVVLGYDLGVPAFKVKNYVVYMDHYNTIDSKEDIVFNPIATLPKVISPTKVPIPPSTNADDGDDSEGSSEVDFVDSDYEVDDDHDDLFCDNVDEGVVDEGAAKGIIVRAGSKRNAPTGTYKD
ncbi:unnamed protein product [Miscanthus lutarioriparius]|uniref:Uncharacterized protein n=1 Tax=Miscanthus lutarioriparius TaxID=422564 RepID=A0A811S9F0_9POAL|nr:unnamed protein product [Miscanthus lutarioriparius]